VAKRRLTTAAAVKSIGIDAYQIDGEDGFRLDGNPSNCRSEMVVTI
jgi:hypothetical protein